MQQLEDGAVVRARVIGFLPGHKVVLDVEGEALVAWSDLPLVYGKWVTALVESRTSGLCLRVKPEDQDASDADALERLIRRSAAELGVPIDEALFREVSKQLKAIHPGLQSGPVSLRELEPQVLRILAAKSRGLPPSARAWADIRMGSEARMGTALARLIESLEEASHRGSGELADELEARARQLRTFFIDLETGPFEAQLQKAVRRCGYDHEAALARAGFTSWPRARDEHDADMKGALLATAAILQRLCGEDLRHQSEACRMSLERSIAWCTQSLDILEGLQVQNLPTAGDPEPMTSFQVPVRRRECIGTLHLMLAKNRSRFWLEMKGQETIHASMRRREEGFDLQLHLPPGAREWHLDTTWCESFGVRIRVVHEAASSSVAHVDLAI